MQEKEFGFASRMTDIFKKRLPEVRLVVFDETDSTNTRAKLAADKADGTDTFFIARRQTGGRGRLGRSFLSEEGGLYLSYLCYPSLPATDAIRLTAYAAVCLCETLAAHTPLSPKIKWVNDCFVGDKKLAGILTEGGFSQDGSHFDYAVVGIGVNLSRVDFGEGLSDIATDVESECGVLPDICEIAASLAERLVGFSSADPSEYMKKYRDLSLVMGRRVRVICPSGDYFATVTDMDGCGALTVTLDSGEARTVLSGEVSLKLN